MTTTTDRTARFLIVTDTTTAPDPLETQRVATIHGAGLRPGMVLLDDLDCPSVVLDHKMRTGNRQGQNRWMGFDLDTRELVQLTTARGRIFRVAGRP